MFFSYCGLFWNPKEWSSWTDFIKVHWCELEMLSPRTGRFPPPDIDNTIVEVVCRLCRILLRWCFLNLHRFRFLHLLWCSCCAVVCSSTDVGLNRNRSNDKESTSSQRERAFNAQTSPPRSIVQWRSAPTTSPRLIIISRGHTRNIFVAVRCLLGTGAWQCYLWGVTKSWEGQWWWAMTSGRRRKSRVQPPTCATKSRPRAHHHCKLHTTHY